jgi:uncharacterized protein (TIRG00374 family)
VDATATSPGVFARLRGKLLIGIALGAVVFVGFSAYSGKASLADALKHVRWTVVPFLFGLAFLNYVLRFLKWQFYLRRLAIDLPTRDSLAVFFSGLVMVITPGKMGELLKAYLLRRLNDTPISRSAPIVVAERLTDFLALIVLSSLGIGLYAYRAEKLILAGTLVAIALFVALITWRRLSLAILAAAGRTRPLARIGQRLHVAYESIYALVTPGALAWATVLSVAAWALECLGLWIVMRFFLPDASVLACVFIYAISTIAGAISMLPGGLGSTELGMSLLLRKLVGASVGQATAATFLIRIITLWFAVVLGAIVLAANRRRFEGVAALLDQDRV